MSQVITSHQAKDTTTTFGFWVYIMTDCVLFATLFATYAVLHNNTFGGASAQQIINAPYILTETLVLLTSSFTCGLSLLAVQARRPRRALAALAVTFLLGLTFLALEVSDFGQLVHMGDSWQRSGFLSAFFTLVGTHGLHITAGLIWMAVMMVKLARSGLTRATTRQLTLLSLFWHFLDLIWIFIFTIVYLFGAAGI